MKPGKHRARGLACFLLGIRWSCLINTEVHCISMGDAQALGIELGYADLDSNV